MQVVVISRANLRFVGYGASWSSMGLRLNLRIASGTCRAQQVPILPCCRCCIDLHLLPLCLQTSCLSSWWLAALGRGNPASSTNSLRTNVSFISPTYIYTQYETLLYCCADRDWHDHCYCCSFQALFHHKLNNKPFQTVVRFHSLTFQQVPPKIVIYRPPCTVKTKEE